MKGAGDPKSESLPVQDQVCLWILQSYTWTDSPWPPSPAPFGVPLTVPCAPARLSASSASSPARLQRLPGKGSAQWIRRRRSPRAAAHWRLKEAGLRADGSERASERNVRRVKSPKAQLMPCAGNSSSRRALIWPEILKVELQSQSSAGYFSLPS